MSRLRDTIGKIYGVHLDDTYDLNTYFSHLGVTGVIDQKRTNETIIVLIKEVEDLRRALDRTEVKTEPVKKSTSK
jgi:hypothetical protein